MFEFLNKDRKNLIERNKKLEAENDSLLDERRQLKQELSDLKIQKDEQVKTLELDRKKAEEDIKHMQRIKDESREIEFQKKELALEKEKDAEVARVKDEYRDKLENQLQKQADEFRQLVTDLSSRFKFTGKA